MHKVYLLIRRNKQTGPYTLEELVQLGLQPFDLIWVEGKSAAWSYPSEISSLQPYLKKDDESAKIKEERVPPTTRPDGEPPTVQQESESLKGRTEPAAPPKQSSHEAFMPSTSEKVSPDKVPSPKLVYISLPKNKGKEATPVKNETPPVNIEQKAEELKRRAESYIPEKKSAEARETIQTKYARPLDEIEEDFATWTYNKKSKKQIQLPVKTIMSVALGVLLIAGTYGIAKYAFSTSEAPASKDTVIETRQNPELTTEKLILETPPKTVAVEKAQTRTVREEKAQTRTVREEKIQPKAVAKEKVPAPTSRREEPVVTKDRKQQAKPEVVAAKKSPVTEIKTEPKTKQKASPATPPVVKDEKPMNEDVAANTNKPRSTPPPSREEPVVAATPAKKKSFDEKVDEFINQFKRKKTEEKPSAETTEEETQPGVANTGTAERKARRRDEEPVAATPEPQNLEEFVEVSSNQKAENWMLGIHNLRLTVSNRSTVPVKKAAVEIRYLNNLNEVIEKRVLNVTNIPAKKSVLVFAPDHRLAERLESRVLSAEGN